MPNGDGTGPWWAKEGWRCRRSGQGRCLERASRWYPRRRFDAEQIQDKQDMQNPETLEIEAQIMSMERDLRELKRKKQAMQK